MKINMKYFIFAIFIFILNINIVHGIEVVYKSGEGIGNDYTVNVNPTTLNYSPNSITLINNKDVTNYTHDDVQKKISGSNHTYRVILTGWKLTSITQNGKVIDTFAEPKHYNYASRTFASKDIGTVYSESGYYSVPEGTTRLVFEAVYGWVIYMGKPYNTMVHDKNYWFNTTKSIASGRTGTSESNFGTNSSNDTISSLKRGYEILKLAGEDTDDYSMYDHVFMFTSDMYETRPSTSNAPSTSYDDIYNGKRISTKPTVSAAFGYVPSSSMPGVTFTSDESSSNKYTLYYKLPTWSFSMYGKTRFDNIKWEMIPAVPGGVSISAGAIYLTKSTNNRYAQFEATERFETKTNITLYHRDGASKIVLKGGRYIVSTASHSSSNSATFDATPLKYILIGGKASIANYSNMDYSELNPTGATFLNPVTLCITGGKIDGNVYLSAGSSYGTLDFTRSDKVVYLFATGGYISANIYGGGKAKLNGGVSINLDNVTHTSYIYGGGANTNSVIKDDVTININNSKINNIYGGPSQGSINGKIHLNINNTTVSGNLYGAGYGSSAQTSNRIAAQGTTPAADVLQKLKNVSYCSDDGMKCYDANGNLLTGVYYINGIYRWYADSAVANQLVSEPASSFLGFSSDNHEKIRTRVHLNSSIELTNNTHYYNYTDSSLSAAKVNDVEVNITNSTINSSVYGGGNRGSVYGDVKLNIVNSNLKSNVFGGGYTVSEMTVPVYIRDYSLLNRPYSYLNSSNNLAVTSENTKFYENRITLTSKERSENFTWKNYNYLLKNSSEWSAKEIDEYESLYGSGSSSQAKVISGIDYVNYVLYSETADKMGFVYGNIDVNIDNSTLGGSVYGGGYAGIAKGYTNISIINNSKVSGVIFGGSYSSNQDGNSSIIVKDSTCSSKIFGGGNSGKVKNTSIEVTGGTINGDIFGGGNLADITGNATIKLKDVNVPANIYGGGNKGEVVSTNLEIINVTSKDLFGGGNSAKVNGNVYLTVTGSKFTNIYGGGNSAGVNGSAESFIIGSTINGNLFGGNNLKGELKQNTHVTICGNSLINGDVFGGGNTANVGNSKNNNSTSTVDIIGGVVNGDVYGGSNQSVVYGGTNVNIGKNTLSTDLESSDILIKGSIFGGGKSSSAGTDTYDFSYIAVTDGTHINIDGNKHNNFDINGSIFGSGNASSSEGDSIIHINNYGSSSDIKNNISIQRANSVTLENSYINLSGTTDRTNEFSNELFAISRVDDFIVKDGTYIYLESGTNLLKKWESLDKNNNHVTKDNTINRLYIIPGKNMKITTSQDAKNYGEVVGMTFLGIYDNESGTYESGIYDTSYKDGDKIESGDIDVFNSGTYVLGFHSTNYNVNGFTSNFEDNDKISYQVINPTPNDQVYHFWKVGAEKEIHDISLTASKYSILGKYGIVNLINANENTVYTIESIDLKKFDGTLLNPSDIKEIDNSGNAEKNVGLKISMNGAEWESDKEYYFVSDSNDSAISSSTDSFKISNTISNPGIEFYLSNANNISKNLDLGTIVIKINSEYRIPGTLNIEQKDIIINVSVNTQVYTNVDYERQITYGIKSEPFGTTSVNITQPSAFSVYFSAKGVTDSNSNPYKKGDYYRKFVSSEAFPAGTTITMMDISNSKVLDKTNVNNPNTYYYIVSKEDYNNNKKEFLLEEFKKMGTYNNTYYSDDTNYINKDYLSENFIFVVNFANCNNYLNIGNNYSVNLENKYSTGADVIVTNGSTGDNNKYNIIEDNDSFSIRKFTLDKEVYYPNDTISTSLELKSKNKINDTSLLNKNLAVGISLLDSNDNLVDGNKILGLKYIVDGNTYNIGTDGKARFIIQDSVVDLLKNIDIDLSDTKLDSGEYKIKVDVYLTSSAIVHDNAVDSITSNTFIIKNVNYGLRAVIDDKDRVIKKSGITMKNNNKLDYTLHYKSNLDSPNVRIVVTDKEDNIINISNLFTNTSSLSDDGYAYIQLSNLSATNDITLNLKNNLTTGSYYIKFMLYDNNKYIGSIKNNIVVKRN